MKTLVHDYSGHPFQVQLSRELSRRGHEVVHSYCEAYVSGKGHLAAEPDESIVFEPIGQGMTLAKMRFRRRLLQELLFGVQLVRQVRRVRPQVVMASNVPIPTLVIFAVAMVVFRIPWVLWHQDVQAVAIRSFAGNQLSKAWRIVAAAIGVGEKWCARRAHEIVVIARSFVDVHREWRTAHKVTVIPNWAPLDEIYPVPRDNPWAEENGVVECKTLLYSGTLGLKHNPALLVGLARHVIDCGQAVQLVVVNEGPATEVLREEAERLGVPLKLLPFQPYDRLPEVLGSGDILVVLLEQDAGAFSVPSKTLSYLCAGRPVLGLMPEENLAAQLVSRVNGCVESPEEASLPAAAAWVTEVLSQPGRGLKLGLEARGVAEREFALTSSANRFETILLTAIGADASSTSSARAFVTTESAPSAPPSAA